MNSMPLETLSISHTIQRVHHVYKTELSKRNTKYTAVVGIGGIAGELTDVWAFCNLAYTACVVVQRMQPSDQLEDLHVLLTVPHKGVYLGSYAELNEEGLLDTYTQETMTRVFAHMAAFPGGHTDYDLPQLVFDDFAPPAS
jgi:hypothetical protein